MMLKVYLNEPPFSKHGPVPTGFREPGRVSWTWLTFLTVSAVVLRLVNLNSDLWLDEIGTLVSYVRFPVSQIIRSYESMNQHLLYSVLARLSVDCFGESAWALRLPAVLFGIAAVPALYYAARVITSERESLLATALLAYSYHHIWFSQDARGYSAMVFFTLLGAGFLIRALVREANTGYWVGYAICMTLGIVSLQNTVFVVMGEWLCCVWILGLRRTSRLHYSVAAAAVLSVLCHSLMLSQIIHFTMHAERTGLGWTKITELAPVVRNGLIAGLGLAGLVLGSLPFLAGFRSYWRQTRLIAGLLVAPVVFNVVVLVVLGIGAYPRSFLYELPFALLLVVRGMTLLCQRIGGERVATAVCVALLLIACFPLIGYYVPKQDFSGALAYVRAHRKEADILMAADLAGTCYRRYYFPEITLAKTPQQLEDIAAAGQTAWVLYSFPREFQLRSPELFRYLRTQLESVAIYPGTLGGGDIYVARTRSASKP